MALKDNCDKDTSILSRLSDLCDAAERGEVGISAFLSPRELHIAESFLTGKGVSFFTFGGYAEAERKRVYILPDYMVAADGIEPCQIISEFGYSTKTAALKIVGSGYRVLTHRDILGSLLGLGVERSVLGDIILLDKDGKETVIICDEAISEFFIRDMTHVANDKIRISRINLGEWESPPRRMQPIQDTVASKRLDAVIAALCNISRDKARETVESGLVEIDFEREERPDRGLVTPCTVSIRGFGRFKVSSLNDKTKKGRLRLEAEKFI